MTTPRPRPWRVASRCAPLGMVAALGGVALMASACSSSPSTSSTTTIDDTSTSASDVDLVVDLDGRRADRRRPTAEAQPPPAVENLVATSQVKAGLTAAFVAMKQIPAADVLGTRPGSVYYAYDTATETYWAFAAFDLSAGRQLPGAGRLPGRRQHGPLFDGRRFVMVRTAGWGTALLRPGEVLSGQPCWPSGTSPRPPASPAESRTCRG